MSQQNTSRFLVERYVLVDPYYSDDADPSSPTFQWSDPRMLAYEGKK
jgi:hypothetical protein